MLVLGVILFLISSIKSIMISRYESVNKIEKENTKKPAEITKKAEKPQESNKLDDVEVLSKENRSTDAKLKDKHEVKVSRTSENKRAKIKNNEFNNIKAGFRSQSDFDLIKKAINSDKEVYDSIEIFESYRSAVMYNTIQKWKELADKLRKKNRNEEAIIVYKNIIESTSIQKEVSIYVNSLTRVANIYFESARYKEAKEVYMKILSISSNQVDTSIIVINAFYLGEVYSKEDNMALATLMYEKSKDHIKKLPPSSVNEHIKTLEKIKERLSEIDHTKI